MEKENILQALYYDNYLGEANRKKKIKIISFDKESIYILSKINEAINYASIDSFIRDCIEKFRKEKMSFLNSEYDQLLVEKNIVNITYPYMATIKKLNVLQNVLDKKLWIKIFNISLEKIKIISYLIFFRIITYNCYCDYKLTSIERIRLFNTTKPNYYFKPEDIALLCNDISVEDVKKYFSLFSINISNINNEFDGCKLIEFNGNYTSIFITEFGKNLYKMCEDKIIDYHKQHGISLDNYYKNRGINFENLVKSTLELLYPKVNTRIKYISNKKEQREIDNLVISNGSFYNYECKSSYFNINEISNKKEADKRIIQSFGDGFISLSTFFETICTSEGLSLNISGSNVTLNDSSKCYGLCITLNPLEFVSTELHLTENIEKYISYYPITIDFIDWYTIILYSYINNKLDLYENYIKIRINSLNKSKKLKLDIDEINALGILLDKRNSNIKSIIESSSNDFLSEISVNNNFYREDFNHIVEQYLLELNFSKHICTIPYNIFCKMHKI